MQLEIKPDYFTEGVKLLASFDKFTEDEREAAVNVTVPDLKNVVINPIEEEIAAPEKEIFIAEFKVTDKPQKVKLAFSEKERLSIGRTKENDLVINDPSISKIHAALVLNLDRQLMVADTGSTNGTFINNQRISYGRAVVINEGDKLKFGTVEVALEHIINEKEFVVAEDFSTKEEAIKEVVNSAKMVSINEVYSPKEDVATKEDVL
jgi:pSer/pThr/pTyr-binding forkhead associated (FHA) protein